MEWSAEELTRVLIGKYPPSRGELKACWVVASSGRTALAESLADRPSVDGLRVVPLVLRDELFEIPNAVLEDLLRLVEGSRDVIEKRMADATEDETVVLVVISLCSLNIPQVTSPVGLPIWMPAFGGRVLPLHIDDLETNAYGPMDSPLAHIDRLKGTLFECDNAIVRRLHSVKSDSRSAVVGFWNDVRDSSRGGETISAFLDGATAYLATVHNASGYRPNVKEGITVVARVVRLVGSHAPDYLAKSGERFLDALVLGEATEATIRLSLHGALNRTSQPVSNGRRIIGSNLLLTIYAAHQFTTAAAHSDAYTPQLLSVMSATSFDLAETLSVLAHTVSLAS